MDRIGKWLLLGLVLTEVVLVWTGMLDVRAAVGIVAGIEIVLLLVASRQLISAVRRYRHDRAVGLDAWLALEEGLAILLPRPIARVMALEARLWACLGVWLSRRHRPSKDEFRYHKRSPVGSLLLVVVFTAPVEILLFELLIPWAWLRWLLLAAAIYGTCWAFGYYASLVVLPHRLEGAGFRLHYGILAEATLPYATITRVERERRRSPGGRDGLRVPRDENAAYVAVGGCTDVTLHLQTAQTLRGFFGRTKSVMTVHVAADEPELLVRQLAGAIADSQARLSASSQSELKVR